MKKMSKLKQIKVTPWKYRTRGEKFLTIVTKLIKWIVLLAAAIAIGSIIFIAVVVVGFTVLFLGTLLSGTPNYVRVHHYGGHDYVDIDDLR
jgi:uncharacterized membrane protein